MIRFGDLFTTNSGNLRRIVYLNNRSVGMVDIVNGMYHCFDQRNKNKTEVTSLSEALEFFRGN